MWRDAEEWKPGNNTLFFCHHGNVILCDITKDCSTLSYLKCNYQSFLIGAFCVQFNI